MSQYKYTCLRCGGPIQVGQAVCSQCGLLLDPTSLAAFQAQRFGPAVATDGAGGTGPAGAPRVRRRMNPVLWIVGSALVFVLCCGGVGVFIATNGVQLFRGLSQDSATTATIVDRFMRAGMNNDPQAAFALFSPIATTATLSSTATLFSTRRDYFSGYTATKIDNFRENSGTNGTTVYTDGTISYSTRGDVGFTAQFIKDHNQWKLISLQLSEGLGK